MSAASALDALLDALLAPGLRVTALHDAAMTRHSQPLLVRHGGSGDDDVDEMIRTESTSSSLV
jgi:hypothetical protein